MDEIFPSHVTAYHSSCHYDCRPTHRWKGREGHVDFIVWNFNGDPYHCPYSHFVCGATSPFFFTGNGVSSEYSIILIDLNYWTLMA